MVTVKWLPLAWEDLRDIYTYYCNDKKAPQVAKAIKEDLLNSSRVLATFPQSGQIESILEDKSVCFRYLVVRAHYKLIYFIEDDVVNIAAVWDCRQNPSRLFDLL